MVTEHNLDADIKERNKNLVTKQIEIILTSIKILVTPRYSKLLFDLGVLHVQLLTNLCADAFSIAKKFSHSLNVPR